MTRAHRSVRRRFLLPGRVSAALVLVPGLLVSVPGAARPEAPSGDPPAVEQATAAGFDALAAGEAKKALKRFTDADEAANGTSALALVGLAEAHLQLDQLDQSIAAADRLLEVAGDDRQRAKAHDVIGRAFFREAVATEAEAGLAEVSSHQGADDLWAEAKEQYLAAGDAFRRVIETSGGQSAAPWVSWADALYRAGSYADARRVLDRFAAALPQGGAMPETARSIDACLDALTDQDTTGARGGFLVVARPTGADGGPEVEPPKKLSAPQPKVPRQARGQQVQGLVVIEAIIDPRGRLICPRVVRGLPYGLSEAALDAVRKWRFKPARRAGRPVAIHYSLTVGFKLGGR